MNDIVRIAEEYESLLSSEEEMDILNPDHQCRDFKEGQKVHLRRGGECRIAKILYIAVTDSEGTEIEVLRGSDLGNVIE